jgi:hypothetical protein
VWNHFKDVLETYHVRFGADGLAEFRRLAEERLAGLPMPPPEPPEPSGIPLKRVMAEGKQRELQLRNIRELAYRRSRLAALLDQCREVEARCKPHSTKATGP